jgi:hypothetical protein
VGAVRKNVLRDAARESAAALAQGQPIHFFRTRPAAPTGPGSGRTNGHH